jgi:hypothetical protein
MLYPILFVLFVLPALILIEGHDRLMAFMAARGIRWHLLYTLVALFTLAAVVVFLFGF